MDYEKKVSEIVVIGLGIAGSMAAHKLAQQGKQVLVVDKGKILSREVIEEVFQKESFNNSSLIPKIPVSFENQRRKPKYLPIASGGLARFYAAAALRMKPLEFESWNLKYEAFKPYYDEAEQLMGVSGPNRKNTILPPMSSFSQKLFTAAEAVGMSPHRHPMGINFKKCLLCDHCNQLPCPTFAKWSPDTLVIDKKNIKVIDQTEVIEIVWEKNKEGKKVNYLIAKNTKTNKSITIHAKQFVLAGGAFFTPKILSQSGIQKELPLIGTHLMMHALGLVIGVFPKPIHASKGFQKWFSIDNYYFQEDGTVRGIIQQEHLPSKPNFIINFPRGTKGLGNSIYNRIYQLLVLAEDDPQRNNRIVFNGNNNKILLHHKYSSNDDQKRLFLAQKAKKIFKKAGTFTTLYRKGQSIYHACGTTRMGISPENSVTDIQGKIWGFRNMYICDASTFPTSSGVNPSLTIAANALRIANSIK